MAMCGMDTFGSRTLRAATVAGVFAFAVCAQSAVSSAQVAIDGLGTTDAICTDGAGNIVSRGGLNTCVNSNILAPVTGNGNGTGITVTGGTGITVNGAGITSDSAIQGGTLASTGDTGSMKLTKQEPQPLG